MGNKSPAYLIMAVLCCFVVVACSSDNDGGDSIVNSPGTGSLSLSLTDVPTDLYQAVYVKIDEVQVYMGGSEAVADNWKTVATPMEMYNLLGLVNGTLEHLGTSPLDAGSYQQMRLIIGTVPTDGTNIMSVGHPYANYVIDLDDRTHELNIPSAIGSGNKIVHDFEISADSITELILDFDASASIVQAGSSSNWLLIPSIKVLDTEEHSTVNGIVSKLADSETSGIAGALVSLQYETPDADDPKDAVTNEVSTVSVEENKDEDTESGEYVLLADPGSYRLVSYKDGYAIGCAAIDAIAGQTTVQDIELATTSMGMVEGNVIINGGSSEQYATLSFRQPVPCEGGGIESMIEIRSVNIAADYFYQISLPVGTYSLVASSIDMETVEYEGIEVTDSGVTYQNVYLAP